VITEAIILAGGFGTRLQSVVSDVPKCMALIQNKPFLHYVVEELQVQGIEKFIFALGYMHTIVGDYIAKNLSTINYQLSIENEPLGTGGAIHVACSKTKEENVLIVNGDTLFRVDIDNLAHFHIHQKAACTIALKSMQHFDRYGVVEINNTGLVTSFHEKKYYSAGLINGGIYVINVSSFHEKKFPLKFSFERDYLECNIKQKNIFGYIQDAYFIDIGIPEDYIKAQKDLSK